MKLRSGPTEFCEKEKIKNLFNKRKQMKRMETKKTDAKSELIPSVPKERKFVLSSINDSTKQNSSLLDALEEIYKWLKSRETCNTFNNGALPELLIQGFDQEQIWQQIELQNQFKLKRLGRSLKKENWDNLLNDEHMDEIMENNDEIDGYFDNDRALPEAESPDNMDESLLSDHSNESEEPEENEKPKLITKPGKKSQVDDDFFSLADMETFLEQEDAKESKGMQGMLEDDELDLNEDPDGKDEGYYYNDFFDPPGTSIVKEKKKEKRVSFAAVDDDEDEDETSDEEQEIVDDDGEEESGEQSTFEQRQRGLKSKIASLEDENLLPKSWQMSGEAVAETRPEDALLQEHLDFEHATKLATVITQETTEKIEDLIQQRIRDKAWDDVERKVKPNLEPQKYRNELVLDQQKPKKSLAEVYEQEFLKQSQKEKEEVKNPKHEEIRKMMKQLFSQLDSLSNYHYSPKEPSTEIRVVNNMRSLKMEEVAPVAVSDATLLAPEEVKEPHRAELKSKSERSETDKKRERRCKKTLVKAKLERKRQKESHETVESLKEKLEALKKVGKIKKTKTSNSSKSTTSTHFFAKLQNEVSGEISKKRKLTDDIEKINVKRNGSNYKL